MNPPVPGADVRGFYAALGVQLPGWAHTEAPVRCFTNPDAHTDHDRHPSCSVNLHSGAFNCHGCGAHGGAYDAALAAGRSPLEAIDLTIAHGLTERRPGPGSPPGARASGASTASTEAAVRIPSPAAHTSERSVALSLSCSREDVRRWARALADDDGLLGRLRGERGWEPETLRRWGIGFDGERITVPITDHHGALQGVLRLRIDAWQKPKVLAAAGSRLGLIPHPEMVPGSVRAGRGTKRHARRPLGRAAGDRGAGNPCLASRVGPGVHRADRDRGDGRRSVRARGRGQDRSRSPTARSASCDRRAGPGPRRRLRPLGLAASGK